MKISNSGSQPVLAIPAIEPGESSKTRGTVHCSSVRPRNSLRLLLMLFSKNFQGEILSDFERSLVVLGWENIVSKAQLDLNFSDTYYREIIVLDIWISSLKRAPRKNLSLILDYKDYDLVYSRESIKGFLNKLNVHKEERRLYFVETIYKDISIPTRLLPLPRYIGVGYKDKGSSRIPHLDASPRWQELAMSLEVTNFPSGKRGTEVTVYSLKSVSEDVFFSKSPEVVEFAWTRQPVLHQQLRCL